MAWALAFTCRQLVGSGRNGGMDPDSNLYIRAKNIIVSSHWQLLSPHPKDLHPEPFNRYMSSVSMSFAFESSSLRAKIPSSPDLNS